ncbi:B-box zinc finger protein [Methanobacterium sp.]|uniref:B-box zinc finger protein n=1 Tax=Methanobacterium sp. TaxID=2164 RepID=UPI0025E689A2|nr:B-box zinc finger protein [Methanobacterium sp.]MBI5458942.1 B-box zinc finger protein [Methanobacterium sp.]
MRCEVHPDKEAVKFCGSCGSAICEDCLVNADGTSYCKSCYTKKRKTYNSNNQIESIVNEFASLFRNKIFLLVVIGFIVLILIIIIVLALNPAQTPDYMYSQGMFGP